MKTDVQLEFTGERLVTQIVEYWSIEHLHRYALAMKYLQGKVAVDVASGEGYGTYLMSEVAQAITGIDISREAVDHAARKYSRPNLSFKHGSATAMPVPDHSVDVLTSFETIEHHDLHNEMMQEVRRVLKPGGLLIISSPDKKYYSDIPGYKNPFHVKELYKSEFEKLVSSYFPNYILLNQKSILGSVITPDNNKAEGVEEYSGNYNHIDRTDSITMATYNIIVASEQPLRSDILRMNSVFHSPQVFDMYVKAFDRYNQVHNQNQSIINSSSYKLGRLLTYPLRKIKMALSGK